MKKNLIFWIGSMIADLLLHCTTAGAALAENGQPSKSADEWKNEGYTVVDISDGDATGFIVLKKEVVCLRDGITRSGNTFTLSGSTRTLQAGNLTREDGKAPLYCVFCDGKLCFGTKDEKSNGSTLVLNDMVDQEMGALSIAAVPYLCESWIDTGWLDFEKREEIKGVPLYAKGKIRFYIDHTSKNPGPSEPTEHYFNVVADFQLESFGLNADEPTSGEISIGLVGYRGLNILSAHIDLDKYSGEIDWYANGHLGFQFEIDTLYLFFWPAGASEDPDNYLDYGRKNITAKGEAAVTLAIGPEFNSPVPFLSSASFTLASGVAMRSTPESERFVPADTKDSWHACEQCLHEDLYTRYGPLKATVTFPWDDEPTTIFSTDPKDLKKIYTWYYSATYNEFGEGDCPHFGYRTNVTLTDQHKKPLENVFIYYYPVPEHFEPYSTAYTDSDGKATIYMPVSGSDPSLLICQMLSPANPEYLIKYEFQIQKSAQVDDLQYEIIIPEKIVRFFNSESGEATDWPENIVFSPFYSRRVTLSDNIPGLSGRIFTGWNTARDGSGKSFTPGTTLVLEDHLDLWAQWELAGDSWYVSYNANGGTKAPGPQIVTRGRNAILTAELPENGSLIFKGWTPDPQHPDLVYQPGDVLPYDSTKSVVVLYALWDLSPVPQPIHISFEPNGGQGAGLPPDVWLERGTWMQLKTAVAPAGSAYTFRGWSEDPGAEDPEYLPGTSYYFFRDTVLYAVWDNLDTVTLTFLDSLPDPVSEMPAPISIVPSMSRDVRIPSQFPEKSGRIFTGWNTAGDGSGTTYVPGSVITLLKNTVLWAQWQTAGDSWYVSYDANGGTKAPGPQIVPRGSNAVLTTELPENGSLIFKGWTPDPQNPGTVYQPGDTLPYDSTRNVVVLYAIWDLSPVPQPIHITFDCGGVEEAYMPLDIWLKRGSWVTVEPAVPPLGSSYIFKGWSKDPHAAEPEYAAGQSFYFDSDTVLYARWSIEPIPRPVIITFDANGGVPESVPPKCSVSKSEKYRLPVRKPVWDAQHEFRGWARSAGPTAPEWKAGDIASFDRDTTLYAVWIARYKVIEGAGSFWTKGSGKTQRFVADGDRKYFKELRVDGLPFAEGVKISSGSTVADISPKAMGKLSAGDHTITFVYVDGQASASFTVLNDVPKTGDAGRPLLWLFLILSGVTGLVLLGAMVFNPKRKK